MSISPLPIYSTQPLLSEEEEAKEILPKAISSVSSNKKTLFSYFNQYINQRRANKLYKKSLSLIEESQIDQAIELLNLVIENDHKHFDANLFLGKLNLQNRKFDQTIHAYSQAIESVSSPEKLGKIGCEILNSCRYLINSNLPEQASQLLNLYSQIPGASSQEQAELSIQLGKMFVLEHKFTPALSLYQKAIDLTPESWETLCHKGSLLMELQDYDSALESYREALRISPINSKILHGCGLASFKKGELFPAIHFYKIAIENSINSEAEWHVDLGMALLQTGKISDAGFRFSSALARDPNHARVHCGLGWMMFLDGEYAEAIDKFKYALMLNPDCLEALAAIGLTYLNQKKCSDLGRKTLTSVQVNAAKACFDQVIALNPLISEAHYGMGEVYRLQKAMSKAIECYQVALQLNGSFIEARYKLGKALIFSGELEKGSQELQKVQKLSPKYQDIASVLDRVDSTAIVFQKQTVIMPLPIPLSSEHQPWPPLNPSDPLD